VRLGWSHGDQEVFTRQEMIAAFDIHDVNKAASAFNPEKLLWLNQQHMMRMPPADLVPHLQYQLDRLGLQCGDTAMLEGLIVAQRERAKTMKEMALNSRFFFTDTIEMDPKAAAKHLTADAAEALRETHKRLGALAEWSAPLIHDVLNGLATERGVGLGRSFSRCAWPSRRHRLAAYRRNPRAARPERTLGHRRRAGADSSLKRTQEENPGSG
jgi:glutamyl-tRNA synthetase